jgi:hypothetical protein
VEFGKLSIKIVKQMVEKFNKDYLVRTSWRSEYQKIIRMRAKYAKRNACIRQLLANTMQPDRSPKEACEACVVGGQLCVRLRATINGDVVLAMLPRPKASGFVDRKLARAWREAFRVRLFYVSRAGGRT